MENFGKEFIKFDTVSSVNVTDVTAPGTYHAHWHNAAEFTVALKDGCVYKINDEVFELEKGDVLLAWPQQIHETVSIPKNGAMFIQFSAVIIENNLDLVSLSRFLYNCKHISAKKYPELTQYIVESIYEIKKIHSSSDSLAETRCKLCIYNILIKISEHVLAHINYSLNDESTLDTGWSYIQAACTYIIENSADDINQKDVADHVGLSTFYLSKLFKRYMNMSFPTYLSNIRVQAAAKLLMDKSISITDCAFLAGFQSTTAFNKAFHEITGYSPRDYRKLYR